MTSHKHPDGFDEKAAAFLRTTSFAVGPNTREEPPFRTAEEKKAAAPAESPPRKKGRRSPKGGK